MGSSSPLDVKRWFDRLQPQTLQIATWLLYINAFFALVDWLGRTSWIGFARYRDGVLGSTMGLAIVLAFVAGGFLMANDRRLGWRIAVVAAFSPFFLRFWVLRDNVATVWDKLTGGRLISTMFEVALCALLLHPQSREHQRVWYR
jgi:uncharacterized membrane protein (DUF4010 family)